MLTVLSYTQPNKGGTNLMMVLLLFVELRKKQFDRKKRQVTLGQFKARKSE